MESNVVTWRVEEACLNAWPALRQVLFAGWVLRFSGGLTRRANSANPLGFERADAEALIAGCEALYSYNRQPTIFRLPSLIGPGMDEHLAARGYTREGLSLVLYAEIGAIQAVRDPAVRLSLRPTKGWLAAMAALQGQTKRQARQYRGIVGALAIPAAFASLIEDDGVAALAFGAIHNAIICYKSVVTDPHAAAPRPCPTHHGQPRQLGQGAGRHSSLPRSRSRQPPSCDPLSAARVSGDLPLPLSTPALAEPF